MVIYEGHNRNYKSRGYCDTNTFLVNNGSLYALYRNAKIYNSAILYYGGRWYLTLISTAINTISEQRDWNTGQWTQWTSTNVNTDLGNSLYGPGNFNYFTIGTTEVYYNTDYFTNYIDTYDGGDIPYFTDVNEYISYITSPYVSYQWSSVPSITGKNNTVPLTTLKEESINDGNPVDDATASAFNNTPNSCSVGGIISADLPIIEGDPTSVALKYNIPPLTDSVYTSVKLVAKKKKIPKSKTDGDKIIDISPSSGSITIKKLDELTKYYFVIFVEDNFGNKAESEPKDITTGEKPKLIKEIVVITSANLQDSASFREEIIATKDN